MELSAEQEKSEFMDSNAKALARCWFYRKEENVFVYGVHNEDDETGDYCISHIMIGKKYQGRGYGRQLIETIIETVNNDESAYNLNVYFIESYMIMKDLLETMGFKIEVFNVENGGFIMNLEME